MLSIGRLAVGGGAYYVEGVASGAEDYYLGHGEAPGRWVGAGSASIGLAGEVAAEDLRAVLAAELPGNDEPVMRIRPDRRPGFDLTFRAPKSVSILYGLGDSATRAAVVAAHEEAVTAALGYLEDRASWARRGRNGIQSEPVEGVIAAAFRHRTSRAGDPHLHTHVVVANLAQRTDGSWGALDGSQLYRHGSTAGHLYEAHLRHALSRDLAVRWGAVRNGIADIDGIPKPVRDAFSQRAKEIREHLEVHGAHSPRAAEIAALRTRSSKDYGVDAHRLTAEWRTRAAELGLDEPALAATMGHEPAPSLADADRAASAAHLSSADGLTAHRSTFDRRHVVQAWCNELTAGATVDEVERLADEYLTRADIVPLGTTTRDVLRLSDGRTVPCPGGDGLYTTTELLALEERLVNTSLTRRHTRSGVVNFPDLRDAFRESTLSIEQRLLVRQVCTSGNGVDVVVAAAGTGKTFTLATAREAWEQAGYQVVGACLSARAAAELEAQAGIPATTLSRFTRDLSGERSPHSPPLDQHTVVIIDEAGMAGTRDLAPVLDAAAAGGAKVVLVGDPKQLPEITAGGLLAGLAHRLEPATLIENRRQVEAWERAALHELRNGNTDGLLALYEHHGRLHTALTADDAKQLLITDWWHAREAGERVVMLAARRSDVDDLNYAARAVRAAVGDLTGPAVEAAGRQFQVGDVVMPLRNNRRLCVRNGVVGHITAVDPDARTVTARFGETTAVLPARYLEAGHLDHAYAMTVHKSQGVTYDRALLYSTDDLYRELSYVGLSRGRTANHLYAPADSADGGVPFDRTERWADLSRSLTATRAQQLALDMASLPGL